MSLSSHLAGALVVAMLAAPGAAGPEHPPGSDAPADEQVDYWYRLSDKHFHEGDYYEAIRCHRRVISLDPTFVEAYTNAAWLLWSMGRETAAFALLERGRENNPKDYRPPFDMGFYHYQGKRYRLAAEELGKAGELNAPDFVHRLHAHALERKGDLRGSLHVWERLHNANPAEPVVSRHLKRLQDLVAEERKAAGAAS